jgi:MazG family protein
LLKIFKTLLSYVSVRSCGADQDRTDDLFVANEALSQLSYSPRIQFKLRNNFYKNKRLILELFFGMMNKTGERMRKKSKSDPFQKFVKIVRQLRKDCPWDREQTHQSIRQSLIEETYEVIEAIDQNNLKELQQELGDVLLHIVLHAVMAEEKNAFTLDDVIESVSEKMIRRHPHVFAQTKVKDAHEVKRNWEHIKLTEGRMSVIDGVPKEMPALLRALRIQEKASKVGFDWKKKKDVWKKVREEINELAAAEHSQKQELIEEEFGDILFALVNYARFIGVNPEFALNRSTHKFSLRFFHIEEELQRQGKHIGTATLKEMDEIWNARKKMKV